MIVILGLLVSAVLTVYLPKSARHIEIGIAKLSDVVIRKRLTFITLILVGVLVYPSWDITYLFVSSVLFLSGLLMVVLA